MTATLSPAARVWVDRLLSVDPAARDRVRLLPEPTARAAVTVATGVAVDGPGQVLHSGENRVFAFRLADSRRVVAKFYLPGGWPLAALREEHAFIADAARGGVTVAEPLPLSGNETLVAAGPEACDAWLAVFPFADGEALEPEMFTPPVAGAVGHQIGRLALAGRKRIEQAVEHRTDARIGPQTEAVVAILHRPDARRVVPPGVDAVLDDLSGLAATAGAWLADAPHQRIHGDLGHWNVILTPDRGPLFVDFDDFGVGDPLEDLRLVAHDAGLLRDDTPCAVGQALLDGYSATVPLPPDWPLRMTVGRLVRQTVIAAWICGRAHLPGYDRALSWIRDAAFWEAFGRDVRDTTDRVRAHTGQGS